MPNNHDTQYEDECACGHERQEHSMPTEDLINQPDLDSTTNCGCCSCREFVLPQDTDLCECTHERQEHDGPCKEESCKCENFVYDKDEYLASSRLRISVLDDEEEWVDANITSLVESKHDVDVCADKKEFQKTYLNRSANLIIIDVNLFDEGGQTGPEIVRQFMELNKISVPCIIMTGQEQSILNDIEEEHKDFVYFAAYLWKNDQQFAEKLKITVDRLLQEFAPSIRNALKAKRRQYKEYNLLDELAAQELSWREHYLGEDGIIGEKGTYGDLLDWLDLNCNSQKDDIKEKVRDAIKRLDDRLRAHALQRYRDKDKDLCECTHERQEHDGPFSSLVNRPCKEKSCKCKNFVKMKLDDKDEGDE